MKKLFLMMALLCACIGVYAQGNQMKVRAFYLSQQDLTARRHGTMVVDQNGNTCALIKIETTAKDFSFDTGMMNVVEVQEQDKNHRSEIWVYVSPGVKKIIIQHSQFGKTEYRFNCAIEQGNTYVMKLDTPTPVLIVQQEQVAVLIKQFLVVNVTPKDAMVTVDGELWPVHDGIAQKQVEAGQHDVRVESPDYHTRNVSVEITDKKEVLTIELQPSFGFLQIQGDSALLSESSIYIDNVNGADALYKPRKLNSGIHSVKIVHPMYKPIDKSVTIEDGKINTHIVQFNKNFAHVTFVVEKDAEIFIDGDFKSRGMWSDDFITNTYSIECRLKDHKSSITQLYISESMSGDTIKLKAPIPVMGSIVVVTTPPMAKLYVDDVMVGETPMQYQCQIGRHKVHIEKEGCSPYTQMVTVTEKVPVEIDQQLSTGKKVLVRSAQAGDKVFVDQKPVGETPMDVLLGFGEHRITVSRQEAVDEKTVTITDDYNVKELVFDISRMIFIETNQDGDSIFVDKAMAGVSPVQIDLSYGWHVIRAQRGDITVDKTIEVQRGKGKDSYRLKLKENVVAEKLEQGIYFGTLNFAYDLVQQSSFGFCVGSMKKVGWYASLMSNYSFRAKQYEFTCDDNGYVDGAYPNYTGQSFSTRFSLMGGVVYHLAGPMCIRAGLGYGGRWKSWETADGPLVLMSSDSYTGIDASVGAQFLFGGVVVSIDAVTTGFKGVEVNVGLGFNMKKK